MHSDKYKLDAGQIRSVTYLAIAANAVLFLLKLLVGFLSGSIALIADAAHSLSDISTDLIVLLGLYFGSKKADSGHPYGHGRIETLSAGFIALILIFAACGMIYYAAIGIAEERIMTVHTFALAAVIVFILVKEGLYRITKKVAVRCYSAALYANAWHHRSDALSSIAVLVGLIAVKAGLKYGDSIAAVIVGLMIIFVAVRIMGDCLREFVEGAVDKETVEHVEAIINSEKMIRQWHKLRTRTIGREIFLDLHILVDPDLNVASAHEISERLERNLQTEMDRPVNITVHIEPDLPEMRR